MDASPVRRGGARKVISDDLSMPILDRNEVRMIREMIPRRVDIFDVVVGREFVDTCRRNCWLRHGGSFVDVA